MRHGNGRGGQDADQNDGRFSGDITLCLLDSVKHAGHRGKRRGPFDIPLERQLIGKKGVLRDDDAQEQLRSASGKAAEAVSRIQCGGGKQQRGDVKENVGVNRQPADQTLAR